MNKITNVFGLLGLVCLSVFSAAGASAHGEDKPGPNGGVIRMPGAFHVEAKVEKPDTVKIHLLDMEFKNPMVKNSEVKAVIVRGQKVADLKCSKTGSAFSCQAPKGVLTDAGELVVVAKRAGMQGNEARYPLPLTLSATQQVPKPAAQGQGKSPKSGHGHGHH